MSRRSADHGDLLDRGLRSDRWTPIVRPVMTSRPGTYALVLRAPGAATIPIGRLGELTVRRGYYVYVGSAFGPGGVAARVGRHRSGARRPHWHVDHLRAVTRLVEVWFTHDRVRREHAWADAVRDDLGGVAPLPRFGASDCGCEAHLYRFRSRPSGEAFARSVRAGYAGHAAVSIEVVRAARRT